MRLVVRYVVTSDHLSGTTPDDDLAYFVVFSLVYRIEMYVDFYIQFEKSEPQE